MLDAGWELEKRERVEREKRTRLQPSFSHSCDFVGSHKISLMKKFISISWIRNDRELLSKHIVYNLLSSLNLIIIDPCFPLFYIFSRTYTTSNHSRANTFSGWRRRKVWMLFFSVEIFKLVKKTLFSTSWEIAEVGVRRERQNESNSNSIHYLFKSGSWQHRARFEGTFLRICEGCSRRFEYVSAARGDNVWDIVGNNYWDVSCVSFFWQGNKLSVLKAHTTGCANISTRLREKGLDWTWKIFNFTTSVFYTKFLHNKAQSMLE